MSGPYVTEGQTLVEPMPRAVAALHASGRVRPGDPQRLVHDAQFRALLDACAAAGVSLGDFDRRILAWLAGWEPATVQVVVDLIGRAQTGGTAVSDAAD